MSLSTLQLNVPRIFISGVSRNCAAEQLSLSIANFLNEQGLSVSVAIYGTHFNLAQIFRETIGRFVPCLEPRLESFEQILVDLYTSSLGAQIQIVCCPDGFFNSPNSSSFANSPAELAIRTGTPTIFCLNSEGIGSGVIPQIKGFKSFANGLSLAGIVNLDSVDDTVYASDREQLSSYQKLISDYFPEFPLISIPLKLARDFLLPLGINSQYGFGSMRRESRQDFFRAVAKQFNSEIFLNLAKQAPAIPLVNFNAAPQKSICRIAVALDSAFNLLYQNNLILLRYLGAELIPFSPLIEKVPTNIGGLYLPGLQLLDYWRDLLRTKSFYDGFKKFIGEGGVFYSEGTSCSLLAKSVGNSDIIGQVLDGETFPLKIASISNQPRRYFSEANLINQCILGSPNLPLGFCLQNTFNFSQTEGSRLVLKDQNISTELDLHNLHLLSNSNGATSFMTNAFINFSSNAIIPFNLIEACRKV